MMQNLVDKIGDWNPQMLREIKGRLKVFPVALSLIISGLTQLVIFLYQLRELPGRVYGLSGVYCNLSKEYQQQLNDLSAQYNQVNKQLLHFSSKQFFDSEKVKLFKEQLEQVQSRQTSLNKFYYSESCPPDQINMALWWRDHWEYIFLSLSVVFIFTLLIAGTYQLINNLAQEERRGTLNFLRLTPQSEASILAGKMLGVPILTYLTIAAAIPLHLVAGRGAKIAFSYVLSFYLVLIGSCVFFYSAALLFSLATRFLGGFQPWLGSGAVMVFLFFTLTMLYSREFNHALAWLQLLSPLNLAAYLFPNLYSYNRYNSQQSLETLQFFYIPIGKSLITLIGFHLVNYGIGTYWCWQGLERRFRNPNTSLFSKGQSYALMATFQLALWGFTIQYNQHWCDTYNTNPCKYDFNYQVTQNLLSIFSVNILLAFTLIALLAPHRQAIQDWARYRHQNFASNQSIWQYSLFKDLLWSEKSPVQLAMVVNLIMMTLPMAIWMISAPVLSTKYVHSMKWLTTLSTFKVMIGIILFINVMMIYTTLAQRMLLMKTNKRSFWAIGTVGAVMFVPPVIVSVLGISPQENSLLWLLSSFPWAGLEYAGIPSIVTAIIAEFSVLVFFNIQVTKQIKLAGESATKALLATS